MSNVRNGIDWDEVYRVKDHDRERPRYEIGQMVCSLYPRRYEHVIRRITHRRWATNIWLYRAGDGNLPGLQTTNWMFSGLFRPVEDPAALGADEPSEWLDAEIDHAIACATRARQWAADVRNRPEEFIGQDADALDRAASAFDAVATQLDRSR